MGWQHILQEEAVHILHGFKLLMFFLELPLPQTVQAAIIVNLQTDPSAPVLRVTHLARDWKPQLQSWAPTCSLLWGQGFHEGTTRPPPFHPSFPQGGRRARSHIHLSGQHDEGDVEQNQVEVDHDPQIPCRTAVAAMDDRQQSAPAKSRYKGQVQGWKVDRPH